MSQFRLPFESNKNRKVLNNYLLSRVIRQNYFNAKPLAYKTKKKRIIMNRKKLNFELLLIFYNVVLAGSIKSSAKTLGMSQPAVTLSLQKIEREIGTLLFKQLQFNRSLKLTQQGIIIFNYLSRLINIFEESSKFSNSFDFEKDNFKSKSKNIYFSNYNLQLPINLSHKSRAIDKSVKKFKLFTCNNSSILTSNYTYFLEKISLKHSLLKFFKNDFNTTNLILKKNHRFTRNNCKSKLIERNKSTEIYTSQAFYLSLKLNISDLTYVN